MKRRQALAYNPVMRGIRRYGSLLLVGLIVCAGASMPAPADDGRAARAKAELKALRERIERVRHEIAADSRRRGALAKRLDAVQDQISAARRRLDTLQDSIATHEHRLARLRDRRDAERHALHGELDILRRQVRAAYENGRVDRLRLFLSGQSPGELGRILAYYQYFTAAQTEQVDRLKQTLAALGRRQKALVAEQAALTQRRAERERTLDHLEAGQRRQQATIAALDARLSTHQDSLDDMRADAARLNRLLRSVREQLSRMPPVAPNTPFSRLKGRLSPPVAGDVIADFNQHKAGGPLRWQGEWLAADTGTPIRAVAAGRVVYVGYMKRYGLIVIVDHGNDYYTLYGHAKSTYVDVGDDVHAGQPVATAGHSGGHRRSGVYFEIRKGSDPVDPKTWLSG